MNYRGAQQSEEQDFRVNGQQRAFFYRQLLIFLFISVCLIVSGTIFLYAIESKTIESSLESESRSLVAQQKEHIYGLVGNVERDLNYLASLIELNGAGDSPHTQMLSRIFVLFSREKDLYDQIRFIDNAGIEIVRVNYNDGNPVPVPFDSLQDKSKRFYVQDTFKLRHEKIYISRMDLNVENGMIEEPQKPVLRFSKLVHDKNGQQKGMVILNLYGRLLLDGIRDIQTRHNLQATSKKHTMLLNAEGYWLSNPLSSESEFAFMYPERSGMKMSNTFPLAWKSMAFPGSKGFFLSPEGMYAFESINFMEREDPDSFIMQHAEQPWKLIVFVPTTELAAVYGGLQKKFLVPFTLLMLLMGLVSWYLAKAQARNRSSKALISHLAHHDHLTGLANRMLFRDLASLAISTAERNKQGLALLFIDLDRFKPLNDSMGHQAGDEALIQTARRIQDSVRKQDIAARLGGDEFAVLLQNVTSPEGAVTVGDKIISAITAPLTIMGKEVSIGASIGISIYPLDGWDLDTILKLADDAMYQAKQQGGGRCVVQGTW